MERVPIPHEDVGRCHCPHWVPFKRAFVFLDLPNYSQTFLFSLQTCTFNDIHDLVDIQIHLPQNELLPSRHLNLLHLWSLHHETRKSLLAQIKVPASHLWLFFSYSVFNMSSNLVDCSSWCSQFSTSGLTPLCFKSSPPLVWITTQFTNRHVTCI